MPKAPLKQPVTAAPRVRRGYFESRFGQLHVHNAMPPGGGFDENTSLICLHATPRTGRSFLPLLDLMGKDRSVYAPDLPGYGCSDAPPVPITIADHAAAIADFCSGMRLRQVDVLGYRSGALVAAELALSHPGIVRRLVLIAVPVPGDSEHQAIKGQPPVSEGSHLAAEWQRTRESVHENAPQEIIAQVFADRLAAGARADWGMEAALHYPAAERLGQITQATLLLRSKDGRAGSSARARELLPRARALELPELYGSDLFESAAAVIAPALREFLRG